MQPPVITSSDCEGAGEVFDITANSHAPKADTSEISDTEVKHFFRSPKYLTVSSQLHLEAFVHEHPKVWSLSPTFRAEKSDTPRHVSEFWMLEAEIRTGSLEEVMDLVEDMICEVITNLKESSILSELVMAKGKATPNNSEPQPDDLHTRWDHLTSPGWPRVRYDEAVARLESAASNGSVSFEQQPSKVGLHLEHEKWIAANIGRGRPTFVTHYPQRSKPFYMSATSGRTLHGTDKSAAACFDLLLPDTCEIVGGSLREHRIEILRQNMHARGMMTDSEEGPSNLAWYLDLRKYGSVPHGGFGLGLDRLLSYLVGVENIKDVTPWPRFYGRCEC